MFEGFVLRVFSFNVSPRLQQFIICNSKKRAKCNGKTLRPTNQKSTYFVQEDQFSSGRQPPDHSQVPICEEFVTGPWRTKVELLQNCNFI